MKKIIKIKSKSKSTNYNIIVENKSILDNIAKETKLNKKVFIILVALVLVAVIMWWLY